MKMKLKILGNFLEDERISMDLYSSYLEKYIKKNHYKEIDLSVFKPKKLFSRLLPSSLSMRFARYIEYPYQLIHNLETDINHIIDHGYAHLINYPLNKKKTIITVHDIIPLLAWKNSVPNLQYPRNPIFAKYSLNSLKDAAHIITVSKNTKNDLLKHCKCRDDQVSVVYVGCDKKFRPYDYNLKNTIKYKKFNFPINSFLILITGHQHYKNHYAALKVLESIKSKTDLNCYLVRLGKPDNKWDLLKKKLFLEDYIIELSNLKNDEVIDLYNAVDCLLFPSVYEGFGSPPLESMACGVPVISSNAASLPEVVGEAGLLYDPIDISGMCEGLISLSRDIGRRNLMIEKGIQRAKNFTWEKNAKETINIYKKISNKI
jgi:glycosyltransferase involved in cell wall biosynthesis